MRELIGAASLARTKTFSSDETDMFPGLHLKPFSPLVIFLFTTGKIARCLSSCRKRRGYRSIRRPIGDTFLADEGVGMLASGDELKLDAAYSKNWLEII